jgi:hypothetical protein
MGRRLPYGFANNAASQPVPARDQFDDSGLIKYESRWRATINRGAANQGSDTSFGFDDPDPRANKIRPGTGITAS